MSDQAIKDILSNNSDYFNSYNILSSFLRWLAWALVKLLKWIVDGAASVVEDMVTLFGFITSAKVNNFLEDFMPFVIVLLMLSIVALGYRLMIAPNFDRSQIATNLILVFLIFTCATTFFSHMTDLTTSALKSLDKTYNKEASYSDSLLKDNIADLVYMDSINFNYENGAALNKVLKKNIKYIDINETVDPDEDDLYTLKNSDVFEHQIIIVPDTGYKKLKEIPHGTFDLMPSLYYRYHVDWFTVYATLLSLAIVLGFVVYKFGRIGYEIAVHKILGAAYAATDLADGRRIKEVFKSVMSLFAVIVLVVLLIQFYLVYVSYVKAQFSADKIGGIAYGVALLIATLAVIDGPNLIERTLGIDAGLKSGYQTLIGAMAIGRGAANLARGARDLAIGNPMSRSSYVDSDGQIRRNLGGIAGVMQRMGRNSSGTGTTTDGITDGGSNNNNSPHGNSNSNGNDYSNSDSKKQMGGLDVQGNAMGSTKDPYSDENIGFDTGSSGTSIESDIQGADASQTMEDKSKEDDKNKGIPRADMKKQNENPIRANIAYNPTGNNSTPHGTATGNVSVGITPTKSDISPASSSVAPETKAGAEAKSGIVSPGEKNAEANGQHLEQKATVPNNQALHNQESTGTVTDGTTTSAGLSQPLQSIESADPDITSPQLHNNAAAIGTEESNDVIQPALEPASVSSASGETVSPVSPSAPVAPTDSDIVGNQPADMPALIHGHEKTDTIAGPKDIVQPTQKTIEKAEQPQNRTNRSVSQSSVQKIRDAQTPPSSPVNPQITVNGSKEAPAAPATKATMPTKSSPKVPKAADEKTITNKDIRSKNMFNTSRIRKDKIDE